ncbi:MAG TPA: VIT1/CCC1 transporter family protein [Devosiaceae bacterium]|nr:VIT1/CCC1 transporter family protein [Devosiaceae bacterium]
MPDTEHSHDPEDIRARLQGGPSVNYLRDWIYGGIDGAVTTFAVVAGVVGANLGTGVLLVLGFANLVADGFSMAASNYSGTKADADDYKRLRQIEARHIRQHPEGELEEMRQIFAAKGFSGDELEQIVALLSKHEDVLLDTMVSEEYGLTPVQRSPLLAALATFAAFIVCGAIPLLPFLFGMASSAMAASVMTGVVFFLIGAAKSRWSTQSWYVSGLETLAIGMAAAGLAFAVGTALQGLAGGAGL